MIQNSEEKLSILEIKLLDEKVQVQRKFFTGTNSQVLLGLESCSEFIKRFSSETESCYVYIVATEATNVDNVLQLGNTTMSKKDLENFKKDPLLPFRNKDQETV